MFSSFISITFVPNAVFPFFGSVAFFSNSLFLSFIGCECVCVFVCDLFTYLFVFVSDYSFYIFHPPIVRSFCLLVFICRRVSMVFFFQIFVYVCHFIHCPFFRLCSTATIATVVQTVLKMYGLFSTSGKCKASTLIQATAASFCVLSNL